MQMQDLLSSPLPMLVALGAIFYFLVFRPQQQHAKRLRQAIEALRRGDTVLTAAGIVGKVSKIPQKEDTEITVEIADGVEVKMVKSAVTEVRAKAAPANDAK
jgi:preprotein translocase subunit YajC